MPHQYATAAEFREYTGNDETVGSNSNAQLDILLEAATSWVENFTNFDFTPSSELSQRTNVVLEGTGTRILDIPPAVSITPSLQIQPQVETEVGSGDFVDFDLDGLAADIRFLPIDHSGGLRPAQFGVDQWPIIGLRFDDPESVWTEHLLSLIHISEPTRPY